MPYPCTRKKCTYILNKNPFHEDIYYSFILFFRDEEGKISLVLSRSVTPELEEKILNGIPNQKCILKEVLTFFI